MRGGSRLSRREFAALLRAHGWHPVRHGRHEVWGAAEGARFPVPRRISENVEKAWRRLQRAADRRRP